MKQKDIQHKVHEIIANRYSPRAFSDKPVAKDKINSMFEAARWAASGFNKQPWRYIYGQKSTSPEAYNKLLELLMDSNKEWAQHADVLVLVAANTPLDDEGKPILKSFFDVGLSVQNLSLQALSDGLYVHPMGGYDRAKAREIFDIPEDFSPVVVLAVGYLGNPDDLSDELKKRELEVSTRIPQSEFVFEGKWEGI